MRLPISQEEFSQLGLDEFVNAEQSANNFQVEISAANGSQAATWQATITRTDSTFDINTRQIDVIAEVHDPFSRTSEQPPLKIGQFVSARIKAAPLTMSLSFQTKAYVKVAISMRSRRTS